MSEKQEQKYFEKLDISVLSIDRIKELIKSNIRNTFACWEKGKPIEKQTFHVIGPAGVGKTQICEQIADELTESTGHKFQTILIKCPVLSRDDLLIPFPIVNNGNTKFKMLYSDFVPTDPESYGLFVIDEFSRGDHNLQQLMWQVQNEYKIHLLDFPKGWFVICLDNPDDKEYSMDTLNDAAGLRRTLHIYTDVTAKAFLDYAIKKDFHPIVVEFIQTHPDYLYDFKSQSQGRVYANPASWERVSNILWGFDSNGGVLHSVGDLEHLAAGLLNMSKTRLLVDFIKDRKDISPKDVFFNYNKVRPQVVKYVETNDNAQLGKLMTSFITFITTSRPNYDKKETENVAKFLTDIPADIAATFVISIDSYERNSNEFKYVTKLHSTMVGAYDYYKKNFYENLVELSRKSKAGSK